MRLAEGRSRTWRMAMKTKKELDEKQRKAEAVRLYQKGAEASQMTEDGRTWKEHQAEAVKWYRQAAELGLADAQYELGMYYAFDRTASDKKKALEWFRKAAEQGHAEAQFRLGEELEDWQRAEPCAEAAEWYRKAARKGHREAMCALARLYEVGHGVRQSYKLAYKWYLKAALEYDYCDAQYNLGLMCQYGNGVKQDDREAVRWFRAAVESSGYEPAMRALEDMGEEVPD